VPRDDQTDFSAEAFISSGAWVSHLVLVEACWVLDSVFSLKAAQIATAVEMLLSHESLALQDPEIVLAALTVYRKRPAASPTAWCANWLARQGIAARNFRQVAEQARGYRSPPTSQRRRRSEAGGRHRPGLHRQAAARAPALFVCWLRELAKEKSEARLVDHGDLPSFRLPSA
jgi:hypothetical protein